MSSRTVWLLALANVFVVVAAPAAGDAVLGGNDVVPRATVDSATGVMFFDLNHPISERGRVESWRVYTASRAGVGQIELNIYRPGPGGWVFVGASPLESVSWGQLNEFALPAPIPVEAGDLVGWWYPQGTVPSVMYDAPVGQTLNNHNWPFDPITAPHTDLPDLFTTQWHGPWDVNPRTYSIQVIGTACPADMNGDGLLDFFDVQAFLGLFAAHSALGDFNQDTLLDFFDVQSFLQAFAGGCP